ncbi:hypothetical protein Tco_0960059 [Tanacetum coccineum]
MTTPIPTTTSNSQMHNDIMAASFRDRPPMLATRRYAQWQSHFLRYVDTKPNKKELRQCIFDGPYVMTEITVPAKPATATEKAIPEHTIVETYKNTTPEKLVYFDVEAEEIHMILSGIGDDIYSTVDACTTAKEMWIAIERESIESYYSRFYKMMNEIVGNKLKVTTMQVNVKFLQQLEWSRFVTVVKQTADLDKESYRKLFDILKQYQNEVNELRAEKSHAPTRNRVKEIAKAITPTYESASKEDKDSDTEQAQRDKDMQKNLALIAKYIKNIYKPTNNNFKTSSNTRNKNVDTSPRHKNDNQTGQHFAKECRKQKRAKDYAYHKEKIMLCKQEEKGVPLSAQQGDWLNDIDEELDKQELEAHYMYMAKIQEVLTADSGPTFDAEPLEQIIPNSSNMCDNEEQADQNADEYEDERVVEIKLEKYKKYKNCQLEKEDVERKLKDTLGLLTQQKFQSDEALKTQAFETFQFKEKNDELVHLSSLEHTRYDPLRKEKEQLKKDFKIRQDKDIKKLIALEHQAKFVNPKYLKKAL